MRNVITCALLLLLWTLVIYPEVTTGGIMINRREGWCGSVAPEDEHGYAIREDTGIPVNANLRTYGRLGPSGKMKGVMTMPLAEGSTEEGHQIRLDAGLGNGLIIHVSKGSKTYSYVFEYEAIMNAAIIAFDKETYTPEQKVKALA